MNDNQVCELQIDGMHCAACEVLLEKKISEVEGVKKVNASLSKNKVTLVLNKSFDQKLLESEINNLISKEGYSVSKNSKNKFNRTELLKAIAISSIFILVFLLIQRIGLDSLDLGSSVNIPVIFIIGIIASLSTCMAVTGGLVLTMSARYAKESRVKPIIIFHISRLISFFILGGLIGAIGATFKLSLFANLVINILLFICMLIIGFNLLELFPWLNKFQLQLPKFLGREVINTSEGSNIFTPLLLGIGTFFLPCGFTQAIQLYALTTGSFIDGATTMIIFALGTFSILALISFASVKLSKTLQSSLFFKISGILIIFFAIFNLLSAFTVLGFLPPLFNV